MDDHVGVLRTLLPMVWNTGANPEAIVRQMPNGRWVFRVSDNSWRVDAINVTGADRDEAMRAAAGEARRIVRDAMVNLERDHGHILALCRKLESAQRALENLGGERG